MSRARGPGPRPDPLGEWLPPRTRPSLLMSFRCALDGVAYALRAERNMRIHFALAALVFAFELVVRPALAAAVGSIAAAFAVIGAESVNTSLERVADLLSQGQPHPVARVVKDTAAGGVLAVSAAATAVGVYVLASTYPWRFRLFTAVHPLSAAACGGSLAALLFVIAWCWRVPPSPGPPGSSSGVRTGPGEARRGG
ncbi:MAG: diacylglycerol kinase family protein [Alicyclobacillus sp.]|nr:diacylglycerol kinase family protein [Alicyclobacillus sp.]